LWNVRGKRVSPVTPVSNLPDLPTLHFASSARTKANRIPCGHTNERRSGPSASTAGQLHLKMSAVLVGGEACYAVSHLSWKNTLLEGLGLLELTWVALICTCLPIPALHLSWFLSFLLWKILVLLVKHQLRKKVVCSQSTLFMLFCHQY